jgi:uncharacterized LabA/DUF88 family protein
MPRVMVFVDFWNFQINWNERFHQKCNWRELPRIFFTEAQVLCQNLTPDCKPSFEGIRIYASINEEKLADKKLRDWLNRDLNTQPGFTVNIRERHSKKRPFICSECKHRIEQCPKCNHLYYSASEKGVDSAIITDMFALHIDDVYDVAILVSADSDLIPMVKYLQNHGAKVINAAWKGHGFDLLQSCWGSFFIDNITNQITLYVE